MICLDFSIKKHGFWRLLRPRTRCMHFQTISLGMDIVYDKYKQKYFSKNYESKISPQVFCEIVRKSWQNPPQRQYLAITGNPIEIIPKPCRTRFEKLWLSWWQNAKYLWTNFRLRIFCKIKLFILVVNHVRAQGNRLIMHTTGSGSQ